MLNSTFGFDTLGSVNPVESGPQKQPSPEKMAHIIRARLNRGFYPVVVKTVVEESNLGENLDFDIEEGTDSNSYLCDSTFTVVRPIVDEPGESLVQGATVQYAPKVPLMPFRYPVFQEIQIVETLFKELSLDRNGIYIFEGSWGEVIIDATTVCGTALQLWHSHHSRNPWLDSQKSNGAASSLYPDSLA